MHYRAVIYGGPSRQSLNHLHSIIYEEQFYKESSKQQVSLRILDIHGAETHENQTPLARLPQ